MSVFSTRRASWVRFKSVRRCLNPLHSVSYEKNDNYTFHNIFTIHHASHIHHQSTDYTEIPKNMNVILYNFPLKDVIPCRQNIYPVPIWDHKPKINEEYENYSVKHVLKVLHRKFSPTEAHCGRLLVKKLSFTEPRGPLMGSCNISWASWIQQTFSYPMYLWSILIL